MLLTPPQEARAKAKTAHSQSPNQPAKRGRRDQQAIKRKEEKRPERKTPNRQPNNALCMYNSYFTLLVLSCLVSLECTLRGLFLAHAAAGLHCTVPSVLSCLVFLERTLRWLFLAHAAAGLHCTVRSVLSCLVSLECTLRGLFLAHAAAGLHCTVRSITPPWAGCSGLMHLNHLGALCGSYTCVARPRLYKF
jgi:hypothetical protein